MVIDVAKNAGLGSTIRVDIAIHRFYERFDVAVGSVVFDGTTQLTPCPLGFGACSFSGHSPQLSHLIKHDHIRMFWPVFLIPRGTHHVVLMELSVAREVGVVQRLIRNTFVLFIPLYQHDFDGGPWRRILPFVRWFDMSQIYLGFLLNLFG
jgi:hypothetical protein